MKAKALRIWGTVNKGGPGSGFYGHSGRPGKRGGSAPSNGMGAGLAADQLPGGRDLYAFDEYDLKKINDRLAGRESGFLKWEDFPGKFDFGTRPERKESPPSALPRGYAIENHMSGDLEFTENIRPGGEYGTDTYGAGEAWATATPSARRGVKKRTITALSRETGVDEETIGVMLRSWASTSNGVSLRSLQMQADIADVMGVELSDWQRESLDAAREFSDNALSVYDALVDEVPRGKDELAKFARERRIPIRSTYDAAITLIDEKFHRLHYGSAQNEILSIALVERTRDWLAGYIQPLDSDKVKRVARAIYTRTQKVLKRDGVWNVVLYRGTNLIRFADRSGDRARYEGNALESWSVSPRVAHGFAGKSRACLAVKVPRERIFCTARTGMGCLTEGEVILWGMNDVEVAVF